MAKLENQPPLDADANYIIKAQSSFIDNNTSLKYFAMLVTNDPLHNNTFPLIISTISNIKFCTPKDIIMGMLKDLDNDSYSINDITLTDRDNDITSGLEKNLLG